ncbi:MAG: alpha/beta hydrolase, partial [Clostridiaceae bacterium]
IETFIPSDHYKLRCYRILGSLNIPVLLISGDNDEITVETMRAYQLAIPDARLAIIPDAGHLNFIDQPDLFNILINRFTGKF